MTCPHDPPCFCLPENQVFDGPPGLAGLVEDLVREYATPKRVAIVVGVGLLAALALRAADRKNVLGYFGF